MPITSADTYYNAKKWPIRYRRTISRAATAGQLTSCLDVAGTPSAVSITLPATVSGEIVTDAFAGYPTIANFAGGATGYLGQVAFRSSVAGGCVLYDRIYQAGSFSLGAVTTFTITSPPSIASRLPDTNYSDIELLLEISTSVVAATTVEIRYTNEIGTTNKTTGAQVLSSAFAIGRILPLALAAGDKGVQKIDSVIIGGTAGTGAVNVIIARKLAEFDIRVANGADIQGWDTMGGPVVFDTSALWLVPIPDSTSTGTHTISATVLSG
jgi:hypothetical protein